MTRTAAPGHRVIARIAAIASDRASAWRAGFPRFKEKFRGMVLTVTVGGR